MKFYNLHSIWMLMMALTIITYAMGKAGLAGKLVVVIILLSTVLKGYFIIADYMQLRGVSLLWRAIMYGWLWSVILSITLIYFLAV